MEDNNIPAEMIKPWIAARRAALRQPDCITEADIFDDGATPESGEPHRPGMWKCAECKWCWSPDSNTVCQNCKHPKPEPHPDTVRLTEFNRQLPPDDFAWVVGELDWGGWVIHPFRKGIEGYVYYTTIREAIDAAMTAESTKEGV